MAADRVKITVREEGEPSGLAMMMLQYFEQNIDDFDYKSRQASKITGTMAMQATEGDVGITLHFKGDEIEISEGCLPKVDLFVSGGIFDITELATGGSGGAFGKLFSGKLRIESAWKHPLFAFRVARFMSLPEEMKAGAGATDRSSGWKLLAGAAAAAILGLVMYFFLR
jgi:hypothetical protein